MSPAPKKASLDPSWSLLDHGSSIHRCWRLSWLAGWLVGWLAGSGLGLDGLVGLVGHGGIKPGTNLTRQAAGLKETAYIDSERFMDAGGWAG